MSKPGSPGRFQTIDPFWLIRQCRYPKSVPEALLGVMDVVIGDGGVRGHAVIPQRYCALLPSDPDLEVLPQGYVLRGS